MPESPLQQIEAGMAKEEEMEKVYRKQVVELMERVQLKKMHPRDVRGILERAEEADRRAQYYHGRRIAYRDCRNILRDSMQQALNPTKETNA